MKFNRYDISKSGIMHRSDLGQYVEYHDFELVEGKLQDAILMKESHDKINLEIKTGLFAQLKIAQDKIVQLERDIEFMRDAKKREMHIHEIASLIGRGTFYEDATAIYELGYRSLRVNLD